MSKYKICVTVPEDEADQLREVIGAAGAGKIGSYAYCSFSIKGVGRFMPMNGANPTIGQVGKLEAIVEERIEVICDDEHLKTVVAAIREAHSYEEPAIEVCELVEV